MGFTQPYYLLLLLILPIFWRISFKRKELFPPWQFYLLTGTRALIVLCLVLALAGLRLPLKIFNELNIMVVTDFSNSISSDSRKWVKNYILRRLEAMQSKDKLGWISFGQQAHLEQKPTKKSTALKAIEESDRWDNPGDNFTDIESAIRLSLAAAPDNSATGILLFSDGNENLGQAINAANLARNKKARIYPILPPQLRPKEILLERIKLPDSVMIGEAFGFKLNIANLGPDPCPAKLKIMKNEQPLFDETLILTPGVNYFSHDDVLTEAGGYKYSASIVSDCDTNVENNKIMAQILAGGKPKILCIDGHNGRSSFMAGALKIKNVDVEIENSDHIPKQLSQLAEFDALVLNNVSRSNLSENQMLMIKDYVADMGGGLVMIGGEDSFSAGNYSKTPIEQILPVIMEHNISYKFKQMLLIMLIDVSSSMDGRKIALAREAAIKVANQLRDSDMLGIILFDSHYKTWVNLQALWQNRPQITKQIKSIITGRGGTNIYPALEQAYKMLKSAKGSEKIPMQVKHILLLSDGKTYGGNFDKLATDISRDRISISSIAIGPEADVELLAKISQWGKGLFHHPQDVSKLPQIFLTDIESTISKSPFVETPVTPQLSPGSQILKGFLQKDIPPLKGYMVTGLKPGAEVVLSSAIQGMDDPILAVWRYGLGKTVAYTSDVDGRWSSKWIGWSSFSRFWSQIIHFAMKRISNTPLNIFARRTPEGAVLEVELLSPPGALSELEAVVWNPEGQRQELKLRRKDKNLYQAQIENPQFGLYIVSIKGKQNGELINLKTAGAIISPLLDEYRQLRPNQRLLKQLAEISQGEYNPEHEDVFLKTPPEIYKPHDVWQLLVILAIFLFVADVAIRRLWL